MVTFSLCFFCYFILFDYHHGVFTASFILSGHALTVKHVDGVAMDRWRQVINFECLLSVERATSLLTIVGYDRDRLNLKRTWHSVYILFVCMCAMSTIPGNVF